MRATMLEGPPTRQLLEQWSTSWVQFYETEGWVNQLNGLGWVVLYIFTILFLILPHFLTDPGGRTDVPLDVILSVTFLTLTRSNIEYLDDVCYFLTQQAPSMTRASRKGLWTKLLTSSETHWIAQLAWRVRDHADFPRLSPFADFRGVFIHCATTIVEMPF